MHTGTYVEGQKEGETTISGSWWCVKRIVHLRAQHSGCVGAEYYKEPLIINNSTNEYEVGNHVLLTLKVCRAWQA